MLSLISALPPGTPIKRTYVFSSGDSFSAQKATSFEARLQFDAGAKESSLNTPSGDHQLAKEKNITSSAYDLREIPRARKVGQSWLSTPWSCILCLVSCVRTFTSGDALPDLVVCNGPGSAVMMVAVCFLFKVFFLPSFPYYGQTKKETLMLLYSFSSLASATHAQSTLNPSPVSAHCRYPAASCTRL